MKYACAIAMMLLVAGFTYAVTGIYDLALESFEIGKSSQPWNITITGIVANIGNETSYESQISFSIHESLSVTQPLPPLAPGQTTTVELDGGLFGPLYHFELANRPWHTVSMAVACTVFDANCSNNYGPQSQFYLVAEPDLAVESVNVDPSPFGGSVTLNATIRNIGNTPTGDAFIMGGIGDEGHFMMEQSIGRLLPGETVNVSIRGQAQLIHGWNTAKIYISPNFRDSNSSNNVFSQQFYFEGTNQTWQSANPLEPQQPAPVPKPALGQTQPSQAPSISPALPILPPNTANLTLSPGWNMVSTPLDVPISVGGWLVPNCGTSAYAWRMTPDGYVKETMMYPGYGYWIRATRSCTLEYADHDDFATQPLSKGWNLVGITGRKATLADVNANCRVTAGPWSYNRATGQYEYVTVLNPGSAYWIKVASACSIGSEQPPASPSQDQG